MRKIFDWALTALTVAKVALAVAAAALVSPGSATAQHVPKDVRVGDPNTGYFSVEISPGMKYLSWQEVEGGKLNWQQMFNGTPRGTWIASVDPETAGLSPADGKGVSIPNIRISGAPQWGVDKRGEFLIAVDADGRLLQIRPTGPGTAETKIIAIPPDKSRRFPYASRLPERDEAYVIFMQNDAERRPQIMLVDLAQPTQARAITTGPVDRNGMMPTFVITVYRWFEGLPVFTYGFNDAAGKIQMKEVDVSAPNPQVRAVTSGAFDHVDDFPFVMDGKKHLLGGVDSKAQGALHQFNSTTDQYETVKLFEPVGTQHASPQMVASLEPFQFKGNPYATFIVLDGGRGPSNYPGEIWVTGLRDGDKPWRINGPERLNRMDPEVFVGRTKVWVFYYARTPDKANFELRRAEAGLQ